MSLKKKKKLWICFLVACFWRLNAWLGIRISRDTAWKVRIRQSVWSCSFGLADADTKGEYVRLQCYYYSIPQPSLQGPSQCVPVCILRSWTRADGNLSKARSPLRRQPFSLLSYSYIDSSIVPPSLTTSRVYIFQDFWIFFILCFSFFFLVVIKMMRVTSYSWTVDFCCLHFE